MPENFSQKKLLKFWFPLVATWLMMAVEGPFLAALIARLPDVKYNLASYGVAYSLAMLSEAPVIMMMAASVSLVKGRESYVRLRNFSAVLIITVTVLLSIVLVPRIFTFVAAEIIHLPYETIHLTHIAMVFLLPWPGAIGYRRFLHGIMIANNRTRLVSYGTAIRLFMMASTGVSLATWSNLPGAWVGAIALSGGVMSETLASHIMSRNIVRNVWERQHPESEKLMNYREMFGFYYPLALATMIGLGAQPLITVFVGHSRMALESLAVIPVILALVFIFRSIGLSYQEVAIKYLGSDGRAFKRLSVFAFRIAMLLTAIFGFIVFTPFEKIWFEGVSGLTSSLSGIALLPARILVIIPALSIFISLQRAVQVVAKKTSLVSYATIIEVSGIVLVLLITIHFFDLTGVTAAALALVAGRLAANTFLFFANIRALHTLRLNSHKLL